ncbi:hypothetical protein DWY22_02725 [Heyndrickxia coagulans]|nr:hypothetical protein DWY22_02725 [Heyndrickxia coagulans]RGR98147.1 hypothetical protein DWY16_08790 [Heyndrickxia coagulans]
MTDPMPFKPLLPEIYWMILAKPAYFPAEKQKFGQNLISENGLCCWMPGPPMKSPALAGCFLAEEFRAVCSS